MGVLSVIATPIGNLEDLGLRALRTLKEADFILCEDTRVSRTLLAHYQIKAPTISYHQHSGRFKINKLLELLRVGKRLALITDAGTPGLSDPGGSLVSAVRRREDLEIKIESIPGPSALTAALSLAGEGFDRFLFLGFLPHKKGRATQLKKIIESEYPVILYESKHRILKFLQEFSALTKLQSESDWQVFLAREISKLHESFYSGTAEDLSLKLQSDPQNLKGEFVVLLKRS